GRAAGAPITGVVPDPAAAEASDREAMEQALAYMGLTPGRPLCEIAVNRVFIGSCTNSRIEDLRAAAKVADGRRTVVPSMVVPGSGLVKAQAEAEGLDVIFRRGGLGVREARRSLWGGMKRGFVRTRDPRGPT